ncbi:MAG: hypothetical protein IT304_11895 [Dehalococcoidia bacterium]|nr:hypothetical protein [Dehalococcoidia bacterium]
MSVRVWLIACAVLAGALFAGGAAAAPIQFYVASESYYRLDVPAGTMSVTVDAEVRAAAAGELTQVPLWAMPSARNVAVRSDGADLTVKTEALSDTAGLPTLVAVTLARPIKNGFTAKLTMTYDVPAQTSDLVRVQPGSIEALFVSQGAGSFVFIDVPKDGDNYFEPGCLRAAAQPGSVKDAGLVRWVCGDATLIALNTDNPSVLEKCAALDDKCRQRLVNGPFSAFAQSLTDPSLRGVIEDQVQLQRGPVKLSLKYFRTDQAWAEKQFAIARTALPRLEEAYNFPYPRDTLVMRESRFIGLVGAAGIAFPDLGEVLITSGNSIDEEVTVHELAHQWAGSNLETSWLWEGLAEWGLRTLAAGLNVTPRDWHWQSFGYSDPLATWWNGSAVTEPYYWYGKAGAFWFEYEKAIGGREKMRQVLGQLDDDPKRLPVGGRWFMDAGERVSGANLDALFAKWVWADTASSLLSERRAAHDLVATLAARATQMGFSGIPPEIQANLDAWAFPGVAAQVKTANDVLDDYLGVVALADEAGLPQSNGVIDAWPVRRLSEVAALVEDQRQAIVSITGAVRQLASEAPGSPALRQLDDARGRYAQADYPAAKRLASGSTTTAFNAVAAGKILAVAREQKASFKPSFLERVGLLFSDPSGDLDRAEKAYAEGDPTSALRLARSAVDQWEGASGRGLMYLAALAGAMCALTLGTWWLLRRLDPERATPRRRAAAAGHALGSPDERRGSWRDWENTP